MGQGCLNTPWQSCNVLATSSSMRDCLSTATKKIRHATRAAVVSQITAQELPAPQRLPM